MIRNILNFFLAKELRLFLISMLFHFSLFFTTSNKITFLLSIILILTLYQYFKKLPLTLFYAFLILLPFAKGKGLSLTLIEKQFVKNGLFDITYLFPVYFSTFYFFGFYYLYFRDKFYKKYKAVNLNYNTKVIFTTFIMFILLLLPNAIKTSLYIPIIGSALQMLVLMLIMYIPFVIEKFDYKIEHIYLIISSSMIFQSTWIFMQTLKGGYLGKDIESLLPGFSGGIASSENSELLRLTGTFFESSILGTFLITNVALISIALLQNKVNNYKIKLICYLSLFSSFIAIFLTGSRALYLILFILVLVWIKKLNLRKNKKHIKSFLYKFAIHISVVAIASSLIVAPYIINRVSSINQVFSKHGGVAYRLELIEYSINMFKLQPALGVGINLSPYTLSTVFSNENYFVDPAYAHNIFFQLLAETGVFGLFLFLLLIFLIFKPVLNNKLELSEFHYAVLFFLISAQFYPIFINHMEIISYLFLYLGFASVYNQKKEHKQKPLIIIPFTLPWDWSADYQRQTALELVRRDFKVVAYMSNHAHFFLNIPKNKYPSIKNVEFYFPKYYIPFRRFEIIELINKFLSILIFNIMIFNQKKIIWVFDPIFYYFQYFFTNKISLYDCVDSHDPYYDDDERLLIIHSDFMFVNSSSLLNIHQKMRHDITLVPQGFNFKEFNKYSKKFVTIKNKVLTIGYIGGINKRLDFKILYPLIKNNPKWKFEFFGPIQFHKNDKRFETKKNITLLKNLSNVQFNIKKDKEKLIRKINSFDICLIPYDIRQKSNLYSFPMKVFEYFYLGKPVISTPIKELMLSKYNNLIFISNSVHGFEKIIKSIAENKWKKSFKDAQRKMSTENSWEFKVNKILGSLD
jgi:teichuronic acid biosynthesis glycosyltransferase TuaH